MSSAHVCIDALRALGLALRGGGAGRGEPAPPACDPQGVERALVDRLDDEFRRRAARDSGERVRDRTLDLAIHVLAGRTTPFAGGISWLSEKRIERVRWARDLEDFTQAVLDGPEAAMALVDLDLFADRAVAVNRFLSLRLRRPDLVVIFGCSAFSGHDFDRLRASICDASIRLPASHGALVRAIDSALDNHAACARCPPS